MDGRCVRRATVPAPKKKIDPRSLVVVSPPKAWADLTDEEIDVMYERMRPATPEA